MKLYEIKEEYIRFMELVENEEISGDAARDTLESIEGELEEKADNIACLIKNMASETEAIKNEEKSLTERRERKERQIESLKNYLSDTLLAVGKTKIETARNAISFRKSKKLNIDDEHEFIKWAKAHNDDLLKYKDPDINKKAVTDLIKSGTKLQGAMLVENQNLQIK